MTDSKLRELERRWRESGRVEDEAAHLLERVRVGDLTQERLELAAYCGHEGARKSFNLATPSGDLKQWVGGLERWGRPTVVHAALAAAECVLPLWLRRPASALRPFNHAPPEAQLESVRQWLSCPCHDHAASARATINAVSRPNMAECSNEPWAHAHDASEDAVVAIDEGKRSACQSADAARLALVASGVADDAARATVRDAIAAALLSRSPAT